MVDSFRKTHHPGKELLTCPLCLIIVADGVAIDNLPLNQQLT